MSLSRDLLEQARHLSRRERLRPKQASLRRSLSAAYYATFHLMVDEGSRLLAAGSSVPSLRGMFSRSFIHDEMKTVCQQVASGDWPLKVRAFAGAMPIPPELQRIAEVFVELQEHRHLADYDTSRSFTRSQVVAYVDSAQKLFDDWEVVRREPAAKAFLATLFTFRKIKS